MIKKLTSDLKVPFSLEGDLRQDNTPVHQALREALINTLAHADYSGRASVLVVKRPDMFGFRNPGLMRVPQEIAVQGGESDCRNRLIHQMFRYVGLGEQAGSGIPKIYRGWNSQHWRAPLLHEKERPSEQTLLELHMLDLLPEGAIERLILATAITEQVVSHRRMAEITTEHTHDLTLAFQALTKDKLLLTSGRGRGTVYCLPGQSFPTPDQAFGESGLAVSPVTSGAQIPSSGHNGQSSGHSERAPEGWLIVTGLAKPLIDKVDLLDELLCQELVTDACNAIEKKRRPRQEMESIILDLCQDYYLTLPVLCSLLHRQPDPLRKQYLQPLIAQGALALAFPTTPTHPQQAYTAT